MALRRSARTLATALLLSSGPLLLDAPPLLGAPADAAAPPERRSQAFVEGYASALLERLHGIREVTLTLDGTTLRLAFEREPESPLDKLARSLLETQGVDRVRIDVAGETVLEAPEPVDSDADGSPPTEPGGSDATEAAGADHWEVFPSNELFDPLLADPRWPRFSASHQWYIDDPELERVAAVSFGETFALLRSPESSWGEWELAFQAGVFSVFDLEASSFDLVNSDFFVGFGSSHHFGDFTTLLRFYHQSSHLGDEFLLRNRVDRVNLSFEVLDLLVSYGPWRWLRLYAGGGLLVHREPTIDRGITQAGLELTSPVALLSGYVRPVASIDVQHREESDWKTDVSLRAGLQVEHPVLEGRRLQVLGEYYDGRSPNGQFFERRLQTIGVGVFLGF